MDVHEHEKQSNFAKYKEIRFYCCSTFHNNSRVYIGYDHWKIFGILSECIFSSQHARSSSFQSNSYTLYP
jgi:hypothetical protein